MIVTALCDSYKTEILAGVHTLEDEYRVALYSDEASLGRFTERYSPANEVQGDGYETGGTVVQPITGGSLIRPRRKFRPSILLPFESEQIHAAVRLPSVEAESNINPPVARPEINASPRIAPNYTVAETYINNIRASSSWNDPTDLEMSLIAELLFD